MSNLKCAVVAALLPFLFSSEAWAADRDAWHKYMRDATLASNTQNFAAADVLYGKALSAARDLGQQEQFLCLLSMCSLSETLGRYAEAEKYARQAMGLLHAYESTYALIEVLRKQKKSSEANDLRAGFKYLTVEEHKRGKEAAPLIRHEVRKELDARLSKNVVIHSAWTRAHIYLNPEFPHTVAYILDSSGDEIGDTLFVEAAESVRVSRLIETFPLGAIIEYVSDSALSSPIVPPAMYPRVERRYREYRNLLAWQQTHLGPEHPEVAISLTSAAVLLKDSSNFSQAETALAKACEIWQANGIRCGGTFSTLNAYGEVLLKNHKVELSIPILRKAKEVADDIFGVTSWQSSECGGTLVRALKKAGHSQEAKEVEAQVKQSSLGSK